MAEQSKKKERQKEKNKKETLKKHKQKEEQPTKHQEKQEEKVEERPKKILPPLDFSSLVLPFFTQALIELGETDDPKTTNKEENLKLAQRLIDLLDMLNKKTKGNLKHEEEIFLDQCLHQLRMAYMERAKIIIL
jgi:hypothetical protein